MSHKFPVCLEWLLIPSTFMMFGTEVIQPQLGAQFTCRMNKDRATAREHCYSIPPGGPHYTTLA